MMTAEFTIGNEKYKEFEERCIGARANSSYIYMNLCMAIDQDAEAYNMVVEARKLPQNTEEEIMIRNQKLEEANLAATMVPFKVMRLCREGLNAASFMIGYCNPNIQSDLSIAILSLAAGLRASWMNVLVNLPSLKNETQREMIQKEGEEILRFANKIEKQAQEQNLFPDFAPESEEDKVQEILRKAGLS
jgi:methenyltetrahydrofolate cyclohydrolase